MSKCPKEACSPYVNKVDGEYHCTLCINTVSPTLYYAQRHFDHAHFRHTVQYGNRTIYICKKGCKKKAHYHCPCGCQKAIEKKGDIIKHLGRKSRPGSSNASSSTVSSDAASEAVPDGNGNPGGKADSSTAPSSPSSEGVPDGNGNPGGKAGSSTAPPSFSDAASEGVPDGNGNPGGKAGSSTTPPSSSDAASEAVPDGNGHPGGKADSSTAPFSDAAFEGVPDGNGNPGGKADSSTAPSSTDAASEGVPDGKVQCEQCDHPPMHRKNLKTHCKRKHEAIQSPVPDAHNGVCVDKNHGIYLVSESRTGVQHPIHVQKLWRTNSVAKVFCESRKCMVDKTISDQSGNPNFECVHLRSVSTCSSFTEVDLDVGMLDTLVDEHRIEEDTKQELLIRKRECDADGVALVSAMTPAAYVSDRYIFLSVVARGASYHSRTGRVVVTFDTKEFKLICRCQGSSRISCKHKSIAKWYLRSFHNDIYSGSGVPIPRLTTVDLDRDFTLDVNSLSEIPSDIKPSVECFPEDLILIPALTGCPSSNCNGLLDLHEGFDHIRVLTWQGFVKIRKVWSKKCTSCEAVINYSGIDHGIFNFNNKFLISLSLLLWIRAGIHQHIALSKQINIIETLHDIRVDHNIVRLTFYKFLALINDENNFNCVVCGFHPVVLTFDVTKKVAFKLGKNPHPTHEEAPLEVDARKFWDNHRKYVASPDTDRSMEASLMNWAPFIPEVSRKGDIIWNTEVMKGVEGGDDDAFLRCLSEERLAGLLDVSDRSTLRDLCDECGIATTGNLTRNQYIEKLIRALQNHTNIDKFFVKTWYSSGGLLTGSCPHGVVSLLKFLLKPESQRDYGDMLLNLKHPPNVTISDIPHMLATHLNNREGRDFFNPYCGRVVEPTERNIEKAKSNTLNVSIPWLKRRNEVAITDLKLDGSNIHPYTLSTQRLSLYDGFHQGNTKQPKEYVRRIGQIEELAGLINTETAEQVNSFLKDSLYFVDCMAPVHHVLMVKSMIGLRNMTINKKNLGNRVAKYDIYGRLVQEVDCSPAYKKKLVQNPIQESKSVPAPEPLPLPQSNKYTDVDFELWCDNDITVDVPDPIDTIAIDMDELDTKGILEESEGVAAGAGNILLPALYKGVYNIANNCWLTSVMIAMKKVIGFGRLYEDMLLGLWTEYSDSDRYLCLYTDIFRPLHRSLSLHSNLDLLDKETLKNVLTHAVDSNEGELGNHIDPHNLFLRMAEAVDGVPEELDEDHIYKIKMDQQRVCINCPHISPKTVNHTCLSLNPPISGVTDIASLLRNYFTTDSVEYACPTCSNPKSAKSLDIINTPKVLAIHLTRYSFDRELIKCRTPVHPNKVLNLAEHMKDVSMGSRYSLRAVITHHGATGETGHYTTTIFEHDHAIEINDHTFEQTQAELVSTDGYIFLYEHLPTQVALIQEWVPLALAMIAFLSFDQESSSALAMCAREFWQVLSADNLGMVSSILRLIAGELGRSHSKVEDNLLPFIKKLLRSREILSSFFQGSCYCITCDIHQCYSIEYDFLESPVHDQNIASLVSSDLSKKNCATCSEMTTYQGTPDLLTDILVLKCDASSVKESCYDGLFGKLSVVGGYSLDGLYAFVQKEDVWYNTAGQDLELCQSLKGEIIVLFKRLRQTPSTIEIAKRSCKVEHEPVQDVRRLQIEGCLRNISHQDQLSSVEGILLGSIEPDNLSRVQQSIMPNTTIVTFANLTEFLQHSKSVMVRRLCESAIFNCFVLDLTDSMIVIKEGSADVVDVLCLGDWLSVSQSIQDMCSLRFPRSNKLAVSQVAVPNIEYKHLLLMKLAHCFMQCKEFIVEEDFRMALALHVLEMPCIADPGLVVTLGKHCKYIDFISPTPADIEGKCLVASSGELFAVEMESNKVIKAARMKYTHLSGSNCVRDDVLYELLAYLNLKKIMVKELYFLNDDEEHQEILQILRDRKYRNNLLRVERVIRQREEMLKLFPAMQYFGLLSILHVITENRNCEMEYRYNFVNNQISEYCTFRIDEYVELFVLKRCLLQFYHDIKGLPISDLTALVDGAGEQ